MSPLNAMRTAEANLVSVIDTATSTINAIATTEVDAALARLEEATRAAHGRLAAAMGQLSAKAWELAETMNGMTAGILADLAAPVIKPVPPVVVPVAPVELPVITPPAIEAPAVEPVVAVEPVADEPAPVQPVEATTQTDDLITPAADDLFAEPAPVDDHVLVAANAPVEPASHEEGLAPTESVAPAQKPKSRRRRTR